jgi:hypothetical protein
LDPLGHPNLGAPDHRPQFLQFGTHVRVIDDILAAPALDERRRDARRHGSHEGDESDQDGRIHVRRP